MNELIDVFVSEYFTREFREEIERSFSIFEAFEYQNAYQGFIDILMNESNQDKSAMGDMFIAELHKQLNYVFTQHSVTLINEATIFEKNELLTAFSRILHLEDYTSIIRTLETLDADEEQLSSILTDLCMLDQFKIMELIAEFNPRILKTMKTFIYKKEETNQKNGIESDPKLLKNLKLFNHVFGADCLGSQLVRGSILVGERFESYIDYIQDNVIGANDVATATNILSVIYISCDGFNSPLMVYRKHSYQLLQDLDKVSRVEVQLLNLIGTLGEYKKAEEEKARLTEKQITVN